MSKNTCKKVIVSTLVMTMLSQPIVTMAAFSDTNNHWAKDAITKWSETAIINGLSDGTFRPNSELTRADASVIIANLLGLGLEAEGKHYESLMDVLQEYSIMSSERPTDTLKREEAAVLICRALGIEPATTNKEISSLKDANDISFWAKPYVEAAKANKIMSGNPEGKFLPKKGLTRAEMVVMLDQAVRLAGGLDGDKKGTKTIINKENRTHINQSEVNRIVSFNTMTISRCSIREVVQTSGTVDIMGGTYVERLVLNNAKIHISSSEIKTLEVNGVNNEIDSLTQLEQISEIKLKKYSSIKLPNGKVLKNNNNTAITYLTSQLATEDITTEDKVSMKLMPDNTLKISSIDGKSGKAMIRFNGIVPGNNSMTEFISLPTELKITPNQTVVCRKYDYGLDASGKMDIAEIGVPIAVEAYSYEGNIGIFEAGMVDTDGDNVIDTINKKIVLEISGKHIPDIESVSLISSSDNLDTMNKRYTTMWLVKEDKNAVEKKMRFETTLKFEADEQSNIELDRFYGYKIIDKNGNESEIFPIKEDKTIPTNEVHYIKTGEGTLKNGKLTVDKNDVSVEHGVIFETGLKYRIVDVAELVNDIQKEKEPDIDIGTWEKVKGKAKGETIEANIGNTADKAVYYVFYIKTDNGYTYGDIKKAVGETKPILTEKYTKRISDSGKHAIIDIYTISQSPIDMKNSIVQELVNNTSGKRILSDIPLSMLNGEYINNNKVSVTFSGLDKNCEYLIKMSLANSYGIIDNVALRFTT